MSEIEPLDDDLRALLEAESPPAEPPPEVVDRVLERVHHTLSLPTPPTGDPPNGDAPPGAGTPPPATGPAGASGAAGASTTVGALKTGVLVGVFAMGAVVGGAVVATLRPAHAPAPAPPSPAIIVDAPRAEAPSKPSAAVPVVSIGSLPSAAPVAPAAPSEIASNRSTAARDDLAAERAVIETARMAIARNDAEGALTALERHAVRHPNGRLAQERDALRIQALVLAGRRVEAREHASRFRRQYPDSFLLPVVDAALEGAQ